MKKGKFFVNSLILGTLLMSSASTSAIMASSWRANTPSEIAALNKNGTYTVRSGDTVWAIGMRYNIKPSIIEKVNGIDNPYELQIGTVLQLHIYDHGKKAELTVTNTNGVAVKKILTAKDKLDKDKSFGQGVKSKDLTKTEKKSMSKDLSSNKSEKQSEASSLMQAQSNSSQATVSSSSMTQLGTSNASTNATNVIQTPQEAIQAAINKYGTDNGQWRWACMVTGSFNNPQYKWSGSSNVSNSSSNGYFIVRNYEKNDPTSGDGGLINTYIVYPNGNIVLDNQIW